MLSIPLREQLESILSERGGPNLNKELSNIMNGGEVSFVAKTYADYERENLATQLSKIASTSTIYPQENQT